MPFCLDEWDPVVSMKNIYIKLDLAKDPRWMLPALQMFPVPCSSGQTEQSEET